MYMTVISVVEVNSVHVHVFSGSTPSSKVPGYFKQSLVMFFASLCIISRTRLAAEGSSLVRDNCADFVEVLGWINVHSKLNVHS